MIRPSDDRTEGLRRVAESVTVEFENESAAAGVRFRVAPYRRPVFRGIESGVVLQVWPAAGFDDYRLSTYRESWLGGSVSLMPLEDVTHHARRILGAYVAGDVPPGPDFVVP